MSAGYQLVIKEQNTKYNSKLRKHDPTDNIRNKNPIVRLPLTAGLNLKNYPSLLKIILLLILPSWQKRKSVIR